MLATPSAPPNITTVLEVFSTPSFADKSSPESLDADTISSLSSIASDTISIAFDLVAKTAVTSVAFTKSVSLIAFIESTIVVAASAAIASLSEAFSI